MKASEFVKKFGWRDAISCIESCAKPEERWIMHWGSLVADSDFDELKRLVESHELVQCYGGLDLARKVAHKNCFEFNAPLLKAIADVESCQ